ncbi:MAG: TIGR00341 family protein [Bacteroidaceae bacterium]|nr:TIGR00341 family protein [Bacteroidaceae bacterium]
MDKNGIITFLKERFFSRFSLGADAAPQEEVGANIRKSIEIRGTNLWVLILAIFIASLGLNINSTAVIIGAMLISPLMGPIIGFGYSFGVYDIQLMRESLRNFLTMVAVSLITSTLFFLLPIISFDQSELLARTQPTTFDILIALVGGLAGMVAQTRKDRIGTVIPGVAIATALMPPLCTVGYGLATFQMRFILGALYLFTINCIFIALAAYIVTKIMKYKSVGELEMLQRRKYKSIMISVLVVITIPSFIMAVAIVKRSSFEQNSRLFINEAFNFDQTVVVDSQSEYHSGRKPSVIEVRLFGEPLSQDVLDNLQRQMALAYHLQNVELKVRQSKDGSIDITSLQSSYEDIIKEKNQQIARLQQQLSMTNMADTVAVSGMARELGVFVPGISGMSLSKHVAYGTDGTPVDTTYICIMQTDTMAVEKPDQTILRRWLENRTGSRNIKLIVE